MLHTQRRTIVKKLIRFLIVFMGVCTIVGHPADGQARTEEDKRWTFPNDFFFGLATAPAHVEDQLDDMWLDFARNNQVAAWFNQGQPEERLRFFSEPETELDLVADSGVKVFRMGVDWGRLIRDPQQCSPSSIQSDSPFQAEVCSLDPEALAGYDRIIRAARDRGLQIMMTLFHHSLPKWANDMGGWLNASVRNKFVGFAHAVMEHYKQDVDSWITFNEPAVYVMLSHVAGMWPPGRGINPTGLLPIAGDFDICLENMIAAHRAVYEIGKKRGSPSSLYGLKPLHLSSPIGVAHNVSYHKASNSTSLAQVMYSKRKQNHQFIEGIVDHLDFLGLNYYGAEYISGVGLTLREDREYSDSGRAVEPYGLYENLMEFHKRYNGPRRASQQIPFIITENGISDGTDLIRPAYLIEHLIALHQAMEDGVPVNGYVFWTISDNWEWADGYCPPFGLYRVDRRDPNLTRIPTPYSADLFREIVRTKTITREQRNFYWEKLMVAAVNGEQRYMCRAPDGKSSLDVPVMKPFSTVDWRFLGKPLDPPLPTEEIVESTVTRIIEENPLLEPGNLRKILGGSQIQQVSKPYLPDVPFREITLPFKIQCDVISKKIMGQTPTIVLGDKKGRISFSKPIPGRKDNEWFVYIHGINIKIFSFIPVRMQKLNYRTENPLAIDPTQKGVLTMSLKLFDLVPLGEQELKIDLFGEPAVSNCRPIEIKR